ncbi:MAG: phosphatase PAP2 family protein [Chloroflexi bacterium]|nr:phosphatase PAP2 family protein [Chloroflexota bacterium]
MLIADARLLLWLNGSVGRWAALDNVVRLLATDYFAPVALSLLLFGLWFGSRSQAQRERQQKSVVAAVASLGLASLVILLLNHAWARPRPFADHDLVLLFYRPTDPSFPSNLATMAFAMAAGVGLGHRRLGIFAYIVATATALSRVWAGVHYPLDVVAGAALGVASTFLCRGVLRMIEPWPSRALRLVRKVYLA